jgi:glutathione synthase/RimK-type ligase-like ATP-grasp enzyme
MNSKKIKNKNIQKRFFVEAINKAAKERGIETSWFSDDWICELKIGDKRSFIYGFNFPLNDAIAREIAKDKAATSEILTKYGINCVRHTLFVKPNLQKYDLNMTSGDKIFEYVKTLDYPFVCKDNRGAGGSHVFKVHSEKEFEQALSSVWKKSRGVSLCPFYDIEYEYRFFVLDGEIQFAFKKVLSKEGDWKFNLNQGSLVELVEVGSILEKLKETAIRSAQSLNLKICSVDIIKLKNSSEHLVLEVNTAITTEHFAQTSLEAKEMSYKLYSNILKKIFEN